MPVPPRWILREKLRALGMNPPLRRFPCFALPLQTAKQHSVGTTEPVLPCIGLRRRSSLPFRASTLGHPLLLSAEHHLLRRLDPASATPFGTAKTLMSYEVVDAIDGETRTK
ncbi:hypothetical protein PIB30_034188 [Stylosanthes scabra]|uniref:Uncharacterized protein n=1 Tax=Stylosanthes scabra TaxID=79078 RepID=A0ABU6QC82_9FABA|nr:hypothetical protein [Stylosanthes scabra]